MTQFPNRAPHQSSSYEHAEHHPRLPVKGGEREWGRRRRKGWWKQKKTSSSSVKKQNNKCLSAKYLPTPKKKNLTWLWDFQWSIQDKSLPAPPKSHTVSVTYLSASQTKVSLIQSAPSSEGEGDGDGDWRRGRTLSMSGDAACRDLVVLGEKTWKMQQVSQAQGKKSVWDWGDAVRWTWGFPPWDQISKVSHI